MIEKIKLGATPEQLEIIELHKNKIPTALEHLHAWAKQHAQKLANGDMVAMLEDDVVIAKFVELIQTDLKEVKKVLKTEKTKKVVPPKPNKQVKTKTEPKKKPPKEKQAKKFKEDNQIGFGFDLDVQEVEQKPIWEL